MSSEFDINIKWMKRAINLASLAMGMTSPNPMVGAVILNKSGHIVSEGFHQKSGMIHAEVMALDNASSDFEGGSLYVSLEPCSHHGKTPPCTDRIISSGLKNIFIAMQDPDPRVSGKGIKILKNAGLNVHVGICEDESRSLNKAYIQRIVNGMSYGVLKWAMSIDGRLGLKNGKSKWVSNQYSRSEVHSIRSHFDAIIVGGNTLRKDNPLLTSRGKKKQEPLRVVFTRTLNLPERSNFWNPKLSKSLVIYDGTNANENYLERIPSWVEIEKVDSDDPINISFALARRGINNALWECGPNLATAALKNGCIQELMTFISPKILGGVNCMSPFSDFQFTEMNDAIALYFRNLSLFDGDLLIKSNLKKQD